MSTKDFESEPQLADRLTNEEEAKCYEAFSAFDRQSSGMIDINELGVILEMMGAKNSDENIDDLLKRNDIMNNGQVSYEQFKKVICD